MKIFTLFLTSLVLTTMHAQTVPNAGFENWQDMPAWSDPVPFNTMNQMSWSYFHISGVSPSTQSHGGSFAAFFQTPDDTFGEYVSAIYHGVPGTTGFTESIPFSGRPDSLVFWANHDIAAGDYATIVITFYLGSTLIGSSQTNLTGMSNGYERFSSPIGWITSDFPDGMGFAALPTSPVSPNASSILYLDDVEVVYNDLMGDPFPGGDFELWNEVSFHEPDQWTSSNTLNHPYTGVEEDADGYVGKCVKITTQQETLYPENHDSFIVLRNIYSLECGAGTLELGNSSIPNQINGYYKYIYTKNGIDSATVYLGYEYYNPETDDCEMPVEYTWYLPPAEEWTPFSFTLPEEANAFLCGMGDEYYLTIGFISTQLDVDGAVLPDAPIGSMFYLDEITVSGEICTNVDEIANATISVYPNPTSDYLHIQSVTEKITSYEIFDVNGRLMINGGKLQSNDRIDVQQLPIGIYSMRTTFESGQHAVSRFTVILEE